MNRMNVKTGKRGRGLAHFEYIQGQGKYALKQDEIKHMASGNMPSWAKDDPRQFWRAADEFERANGTAYREHTLSLPRDIDLESQKKLVDDWIKQELGDKHPYSYAIHCPMGSDGKPQPHAHLQFSERMMDGIERSPEQFFKRYNAKNPERGGAKKAVTAQKKSERVADLKAMRERWGEKVKECLRGLGLHQLADKVDMRNWKERGLSEPPKNKSFAEMQMEKRLNKLMNINSSDLKQEQDKPKLTPEQEFEQLKAKLAENDKVKVEAIKRMIEYQCADNPKALQAGYEKLTAAMKNGEISKLPDAPQQVVQQNVEIKLPKSSDKNKGFER